MSGWAWIAASALQAAAPAGALPAPAPTPTPAAPPAGSQASDGRCLAAFALLGQSNGEMAEASKIGVVFFYGKLIGRDPNADIIALLRTSATAVATAEQAELKRCSGELEAGGNVLTRAGQALSAGGSPSP